MIDGAISQVCDESGSAVIDPSPAEYVLTQRGRWVLTSMATAVSSGVVVALAMLAYTRVVHANNATLKEQLLHSRQRLIEAQSETQAAQAQRLHLQKLLASQQGALKQDVQQLLELHAQYPRFYQERYIEPHHKMAQSIEGIGRRAATLTESAP